MPYTQLAIAAVLSVALFTFPVVTHQESLDASEEPLAVSVRALPSVAAVFGGGGLAHSHECTASVVSSVSRDLLVTAAHCVTGTGRGIEVAPGYSNGRTPYGVWGVTAVFVGPHWQTQQDPADDVAILRVRTTRIGGTTRRLQDVTGANVITTTPASGSSVTVEGFNAGSSDEALQCTTGLTFTGTNPTFSCGGYAFGSSGSPWLSTSKAGITSVFGVIGGLDQGGCLDSTSYSPPFGSQVKALLARADQAGTTGDTAPAPTPPAACQTH